MQTQEILAAQNPGKAPKNPAIREAAPKKTKAETEPDRKELLNTGHSMNSKSANTGGWPACDMRTWLQGSILPLFPEEVRSNIKEVTKYSCSYSQGTISSTDTLWIPSCKEVFGTAYFEEYGWEIENQGVEGWEIENQGVEYARAFPDDESRQRSYKDYKGAWSSWWWLRSASYGIDNYFSIVGSDGDWSNNFSYDENGVVVGFCL